MPELLAASPLAVGGTALGLAAFLLSLVALLRANRGARAARLAAGPEGASALNQLSAELDPLQARVQRVEDAIAAVQSATPGLVRAPGIVHFRAYGNEGPALSFSIALVTAPGDGFVITSLYGRDAVRVFAKPLVHGTSEHDLSPEEREALRLALDGGGTRTLGEPAVAPSARRRGAARP